LFREKRCLKLSHRGSHIYVIMYQFSYVIRAVRNPISYRQHIKRCCYK